MRTFIAAVSMCLILFCQAPLSAQTRTRRSAPQRRRAPAASTPASRLDQTQANATRIKLSDQIKDLTRFLYLYGRLSKDLELTGAQTETADVANRTRAGLSESVRSMSERLDQLEAQFRFTKGLERQYRMIEGVSRRAAEAERQVSNNQLDQAGRTFVTIVSQLTDVLLEM